MHALDILHQVLLEIEKPGYHEYDDRALVMIDNARRALSPAATRRDPAVNNVVIAACHEAQKAIACTILCGKSVDEESSYIMLHGLEKIPRDRYRELVLATIKRLDAPSVAAE